MPPKKSIAPASVETATTGSQLISEVVFSAVFTVIPTLAAVLAQQADFSERMTRVNQGFSLFMLVGFVPKPGNPTINPIFTLHAMLSGAMSKREFLMRSLAQVFGVVFACLLMQATFTPYFPGFPVPVNIPAVDAKSFDETCLSEFIDSLLLVFAANNGPSFFTEVFGIPTKFSDITAAVSVLTVISSTNFLGNPAYYIGTVANSRWFHNGAGFTCSEVSAFVLAALAGAYVSAIFSSTLVNKPKQD